MNFFSFKALRICAMVIFGMILSAPIVAESSLNCFAEENNFQITHADLIAAKPLNENFMDADLFFKGEDSSSHCRGHHHHKHCRPAFKHFGESVTISMTMTIPALSGPIPEGGNFDVTPFAIAPNGKLFKGTSINIVPASGLVTALNCVVIPRPLKGNYVVGYFLTLGVGSPVFSNTTIANFSGVIFNNPVGSFTETITFPVQTLFLGSSSVPTDVLTVSANFPIVKF
ncbi:MAG: hypothetical protein H0T62_13310 [Parachlamydiaceae bacterium]|nr:hypothetical protein [Parachlamydiaceae bacterium]